MARRSYGPRAAIKRKVIAPDSFRNELSQGDTAGPCQEGDIGADLEGGWGLKRGSHGRRRGESTDEFFDRIIDEAPAVYIMAEGSDRVVAAVFDEDVGIIKELANTYTAMGAARSEGLLVAETRRKKTREEWARVKERTLDDLANKDSRIQRQVWPSDDAMRQEALYRLMPRALLEYMGDTVMIASRLNLQLWEIQRCLEEHEDLEEYMEQGLNDAVSMMSSRVFHLGLTAQNPSAALNWLKVNSPDKWGQKSKVEVKNTGFGPVSDNDGGPVSVLELVVAKAEGESE